jgi:hypothetical protein
MNILQKFTLMLILALTTFSSALAFYGAETSKQAADRSLINDWGNSALTFTVLKEAYDLEALGFPLSNKNITSLYVLPDNTIKTHQIEPLLHNKNFSIESGFANKGIDQNDEQAFFLQGSYRLLHQEKFTLMLTAKVESLHKQSVYQFYSNDFVYHEAAPANSANSYARLGVLGQYSISHNWYLVGGLTSTAHESSTNNLPVYQGKTEQVAIFGTTYTF